MSSENEALLQYKEVDVESQNERQKEREEGSVFEIERVIFNLKQLKSYEILRSALKIFTSNTKFVFLMILTILPFFVSMVLYEIKLQNSIVYATSNSLEKAEPFSVFLDLDDPLLNNTSSDNSTANSLLLHYDRFTDSLYYDDFSRVNERREFLANIVQLSVFYLFLYPLLEFFSMILTVKIAVKLHASAGKPSTVREVINQKANLKGPFVTYLCIHLLSVATLLGLAWVVSNHRLVTRNINIYWYFDYTSYTDSMLNVVSFTVHSVVFLGLLYKYLDWSAIWNMAMVISVISEEQIGIEAFGMSAYYGKHCKKTGFQLMLGFFVFGNLLRLICLYAGLCSGSVAGILITCSVMMLISMGNLVKWVAFVLYFYYCKQQAMEKKVDDQEELGKSGEL